MEQSAIVQVDRLASAVRIASLFVFEANDLDSDVCQVVPEKEASDLVFLYILSLELSISYLIKLVVVVDQLEHRFPL